MWKKYFGWMLVASLAVVAGNATAGCEVMEIDDLDKHRAWNKFIPGGAKSIKVSLPEADLDILYRVKISWGNNPTPNDAITQHVINDPTEIEYTVKNGHKRFMFVQQHWKGTLKSGKGTVCW